LPTEIFKAVRAPKTGVFGQALSMYLEFIVAFSAFDIQELVGRRCHIL